MIRFIMRRVRLDEHTGLKTESYLSVDGDVRQLEQWLRYGGSSDNGYDAVSLLGVELREDDKS